MTEDEKMEVAVFRFGVIGDFVTINSMTKSERKQLLKEKSAQKWQIPFSSRTHISKSTIKNWMRRYKKSNGNLKSLCPQSRSDEGKSRAVDEDTCLSLIQLRRELAEVPVSILINEMYHRKLVTPGIDLSLSTVYRFLHQQNLMELVKSKPKDRRKFEAEFPNELWQTDVMHGPYVEVSGKKKKSYLIAIIDDHSRLLVHGQFYLSETLVSYIDTFERALLKRGIPGKLYADNGAAFKSKQLKFITASLGIALILARPYSPQGKGKIERFFKTVRKSFITSYNGTTLSDLNQAFFEWLDSYHQKKHSSTGQTPFDRFTANMACIKTAPVDLKDHFRKKESRLVNKDRTIRLNGKLYEAPVALIGRKVDLYYHLDNPDQIEIKYQKESHGFVRPVDLFINSRVKRDKDHRTEITIDTAPQKYRGGSLLG